MVRIQRLKSDRGYSDAKCKAIMEKQLSNKEFCEISDFVIRNNGDLSETMEEIAIVMERLGVPKKEVKHA